MTEIKMKKNAAGRMVPAAINGKAAVPFQGVGQYVPKIGRASCRERV